MSGFLSWPFVAKPLLPYPVAMYCIACRLKQVGPYMGLPQVAQLVKNPSCDGEKAGGKGSISGWGSSLRGGRGNPHARLIPWSEEPGRLCPMPRSQTELKRPSLHAYINIYASFAF